MKFLKLRPSREKTLAIFLRYMPMPNEMKAQLNAEKVTNHIILFLLPDQTKHYEPFIAELKARSHPYHEITGQLRPKARAPITKKIVAIVVPKIVVTSTEIREIAVKIGMKKS